MKEQIPWDEPRECKTCHIVKEAKAFYPTLSGNGVDYNRRKVCGTCSRAKVKLRETENPDKYLHASLKYHLAGQYGLTLDQYNQMFVDQDNKCAICKIEFIEGGGRGSVNIKNKPHVDHDHKTGKTRGLLCMLCNTALGKFNDDKNMLRAAIEYLENNEQTD